MGLLCSHSLIFGKMYFSVRLVHAPAEMSTSNHNISFPPTRNLIDSRDFKNENILSVDRNVWDLTVLGAAACLLVCGLLQTCLCVLFCFTSEEYILEPCFFLVHFGSVFIV